MNLTVAIVRGNPVWKVESFTAGKRRRQYFRKRKDAQAALRGARSQRADLGKSFDILTAKEKADVMSTLAEIHASGRTLRGVWETVKALPVAKNAGCTLKRAFDEMMAAKREANLRPKSIYTLDWYLSKFIKGRETADVRTIGVADLESWFAARKEQPRAKKGHIGLLSSLFGYSLRKGYIADNPVPKLDPVIIDRSTPAILNNRQVWKALVWTRRQEPRFLAWLTLALFCGLRPDAEADHVDWDIIDLKQGRIVLERSKVRHGPPRIVDLSFCPPAWKWLACAKEIGSELPLTKATRVRCIRRLRAYLKLKRWPQDVTRHTAASNLLAFHQDAGKVAAFLGNSAGVLLRDYKALVFKEDADRFMQLLPKARHHLAHKS